MYSVGSSLAHFVAPMSTRGDGQSRMLETCLEQAHAPLPADRLDMRACHPAHSEAVDRAIQKGFPRPAPAYFGSGPSLRALDSEASQKRACRQIVDRWNRPTRLHHP